MRELVRKQLLWLIAIASISQLGAGGARAQQRPPTIEDLTALAKRVEALEKRISQRDDPASGMSAGGPSIAKAVARDELRASITAMPRRQLLSDRSVGGLVPNDRDGDGLTDNEEAQLGTDPDNPDTDGDALLDGWEVHGVNGIDLRAKSANPLHKDIFVEMDFMNRSTATNGLGPNEDVLRRIRNVFAAASVSNPDGFSGIVIHLEVGNEVPYDQNLSPAPIEFDQLKSVHFDPNKAPVYHYMIWGDQYNGGTSSGNSFAIPNSDFIVTLGAWNGSAGGTDDQKVGTFIHELGHNLGLKHGGSDHVGYKPNHLSVMNYSFQTSGVLQNGIRNFEYQRFPLPSLNENLLSEEFGLGGSTALQGYSTVIRLSPFNRREVPAGGAIDWNNNGQIDPSPVDRDINGDGSPEELLATPHEWNQLIFNGGLIGTIQSPLDGIQRMSRVRKLLPFAELTEEMDRALRN